MPNKEKVSRRAVNVVSGPLPIFMKDRKIEEKKEIRFEIIFPAILASLIAYILRGLKNETEKKKPRKTGSKILNNPSEIGVFAETG